MHETVIEQYIKPLQQDDLKVLGIYLHGSQTLGYSDENSDIDIAVVWRYTAPKKDIREQLCKKLSFEIERLNDSDHKNSDHFLLQEKTFNVSHRISHVFFNHYDEALNGTIGEFNLYGLGGFQRGQIIYDPENKLQEYKNSLVVTPELLDKFKASRRNSITNNLADIQIAAKREQAIVFIKNLNFLLTTFGILLYLEKGQFPVVPKWIEKDMQKFGWDSKLLNLIKILNSTMPFEELSKNLANYSFK